MLISLAIFAAADKGYQIETPWVGLLIPLGIFAAIAVFIVGYIRSQPKDKSQNARSESDWRIHEIPYNKSWKGGGVSVTAAVLSIGGIAMFVGGFVLLFAAGEPAGLGLSGVGFILLIPGTLIYHRTKRRDWVRIKAVCLDREHRRVWRTGGVGVGRRANGYTWTFRVLCKLELNGREYVVTPWFWRTFWSERGVQRFFAKAISEDGTCFLYVNLRNPLQTELSVGGIADFLLH